MFKFNFFKKKPVPVTVATELPTSQNVPSVDLFVDSTPPHSAATTNPKEAQPTKLTLFLNKDYWNLGRRDGYLYHTAESFAIWKKKTKAEFQLVVDQLIQDKSTQRLTLLNHIVSIGTMHDATSSQLTNAIREVESDIERLTTQKELSAVDEGWIMSVLHGYQLGFTQGLKEYVEGEALLKHGTLF